MLKRKQISAHGIGGNNETWWHLVFDTETGRLAVERSWCNMKFDLQMDRGVEAFSLAELASVHPIRFAETVKCISVIFDDKA